MKLFTFPQKKLARIERNLEELEMGNTAILREIDRLQRKLEKAKKKLRHRENTMFHIFSAITDLKIRFGNSKSSRLDEKIKATLIETPITEFYPTKSKFSGNRCELGVRYDFVK
jgi:chromosome segregation ATPase